MSKPMEYFVSKIIRQKGLPPSRISVFMAILQLWKEQGHQNPFQITRKKVMKRSGIKSIVTYHKCITELKDRGMVEYSPSFNPNQGSKVALR